MKSLFLIPLVALVAVLPAPARVMAPPGAVQRALRLDVVIVGKVAAIEKDTVSVAPGPGAANKVAYKVAVIKIESSLSGATNLTHIRVGFVPPPPADPTAPPRPTRGLRAFVPTEGQEGLFFLSRHHSGEFYTIDAMSPPVLSGQENYKTELAKVKQALAAVADPVKSLKAEKQADRFFAATVLIYRYRIYPVTDEAIETVKVPAEESKLILKALAEEPNWEAPKSAPPIPVTQAFFLLGLSEKDGWVQPKAQPGVPANFNTLYRTAFLKWLDGPGKDYQLNRRAVKSK